MIKGANPVDKILDELGRKIASVPPSRCQADSVRRAAKESRRQDRPETAPVNEVLAIENAVGSGVCFDILWIWAAIFETVVGIGLTPTAGFRIPRIDVVTESLFLTAPQVRLLGLEVRIGPILLERHGTCYAHCKDDMLLPSSPFRSGSHYPVAHLGSGSYLRLTRR